MAFYRKITKTSRQTRIYRKSVILWLDSEKCLRHIHKRPRCGPCQPAFFASPNRGASAPATICEYTYGSVLWMSLISSMQDGQILR